MGDQRGRLVSGNWYAVIALDHEIGTICQCCGRSGRRDCGGR